MPFMLRTCGHALRFMTPDGVCRRCSTDESRGKTPLADCESDMNIQHSDSDPSEMHVDKHSPSPTENLSPVSKQENQRDVTAFHRQVDKFVAFLVNSEESEIPDAVQHISKSMATYTAAERADFIGQLVVAYCEARREDQPKIDILMKELAKKCVLARTHFLQSAKRLASEAPQLCVDWPNIYTCATHLICSCLEICSKSLEDFRSLESVLSKAPAEHADKYLDAFYKICTVPDFIPSAFNKTRASARKSLTKHALSTSPNNKALPFIRSPGADRVMRPLSQQDHALTLPKRVIPNIRYTREKMLEIGGLMKNREPPTSIKEKIIAASISQSTWVNPRDQAPQGGKRPRYVSESSAMQNDMGAKRILESTSPQLPLNLASGADGTDHGRPRFEKFAPASDRPFASPPFHRHVPGELPARPPVRQPDQEGGFINRNARPPLRIEIPLRKDGGNENIRPQAHSYGSGQHRQHNMRSSVSVSENTTPGSGDAGMPPYRKPQAQNNVKAKKFLTAISVEGVEAESPPVTLGPTNQTWARGSGSLNKPAYSQPQRKPVTNENWRREV